MAKLDNQDVKHLSINEFRARGYLHEVNRLLLHPLGLALEVTRAKEPGVRVSFKEADFEESKLALKGALEILLDGNPDKASLQKLLGSLDHHAEHLEAGQEWLGGVWDSQDDPEGTVYGDDLLSVEKAERVCAELLGRREERKKHTGGWVVQPFPDRQVLSTTYTEPELRTRGGEVVEPGAFAGVELPADPEDAEHGV